MTFLAHIWQELLQRQQVSSEVRVSLWSVLKDAYSAKTRTYHNLEHLEYMMSLAVKYQNQLADFDTLLFSVFYHDVVYDAKRQDNELKSAEWASGVLSSINYPKEKIASCYAQIMATKGHETHKDADTNWLVDFDLAILGGSEDEYLAYTQKVRQEYNMYPDLMYRIGRKKVLNHFLAMPYIFKTSTFREHREAQARTNLKRELSAY